MKSLLLLPLLIVLSCCGEPVGTQEVMETTAKIINVNWTDEDGAVNSETFTVIEIDGCEYLESTEDRSQNFTHKGNCKYCSQRNFK